MRGPERSQIGKLAPFFLTLTFIVSLNCFHNAALAGSGQSVTLPAMELEAFGAAPAVKSPDVVPALKDQSLPADRAVNYRQATALLGVRLTPKQQSFLNEHRFLLIPKSATAFKGKVDLGSEGSQYDEMLGLFDQLSGSSDPAGRLPENCRLFNPDVMLHAFHKYLENSLEYLEETELPGTLKRFLTSMQAGALERRVAAAGPLAERFELIAAQMTVPLVILENAHWPSAEEQEAIAMQPPEKPQTDDGDTLPEALKTLDRYKGKFSDAAFGRMAAELRLIYESRDLTPSPLYGQYAKDGAIKADYTQFTPRSHYVKSSVLRGYFRAMMYLGRNSYLLGKNEGVSDAMLAALLLAAPGPDGSAPLKDWRRIMEITGFYAGAPDDICYPEWRNFLATVLGADKFAAEDALDQAALAKISKRLDELRTPRILSDVIVNPTVPASSKEQLLESTKGFRVFGQRFTFDAWVLGRLTAGQEQTPLRLPSTPSALFVPAALGDKTARGFADQYLQRLASPFTPEQTARFNVRMDEASADLTKVKDAEWFSSLGTAWLKTLSALTSSYGPGCPLYMQDSLFPVKQLESFLGSYTELKHDTLLYAKQNYAELGGGGDEEKPPPVPKGFVEPNLPFWRNLGRLVEYVESGFRKYGIYPNELEEYGRLDSFKRTVALCASTAAKELAGTPLTEDEYEQIRTQQLSDMAQPFKPGQILEEKDKRAGLIADLHTDALEGRILYEATGEPYVMLVLAGNEGTLRLVIGTAFNHYELTGPLTARFTDADWQSRIYEHASEPPEKNFWYKGLLIE